jgi:two-component system, cell cycle sensor histidine kinase and response regulator CckA
LPTCAVGNAYVKIRNGLLPHFAAVRHSSSTAQKPAAAAGRAETVEMKHSAIATGTTASTPPPAAAALTILVVEDDRALRELLRITLESSGYTVLAAADAAEALCLAEPPGRAIALLVSDVVMPGMTGPDLARRLRASRAGLEVLLVSGYSRDSELLDPRVAFLQKPFRPRDLTDMVRGLLDPGASDPDGIGERRPLGDRDHRAMAATGL